MALQPPFLTDFYTFWSYDPRRDSCATFPKKLNTTINVKIEFGEEDGKLSLKRVADQIEAEKPIGKVIYKMIQEYIEEKYGFKVHTAYIAEVKRSLGLPMYDCPNAVEELKKPCQHPFEKNGRSN